MKHPAVLQEYCRILVRAPLSVTAVRDPTTAWAVHVLDSLTALPLIDSDRVGSLIDVGSGGGAPGIPLAIETAVPVTLLEATGTKAAFLERTVAALGLTCNVINDRSETLGRGAGRDAFDLAVSRALAPPAPAAELCLPLVAPGGAAILWTAGSIPAALESVAAHLGAGVERVVATGGERRLVLLRKHDPTPERFPRRPGVAGRRPLRSLASDA